MKTPGVRWSDVLEAGRLERLYTDLRHEQLLESPRAGPWFRNLGTAIRWTAVGMLILLALRPPSRDAAVLVVVASLASFPWVRANAAGALNPFSAVNMPSRRALLLSRWLALAPATAATGIAWAGFAVLRTREMPVLPSGPWTLILVSVACMPCRAVMSLSWRSVAHPLGGIQAALLRCTVVLILLAWMTVQVVRAAGEPLFLLTLLPIGVLVAIFLWVMAQLLSRFSAHGWGGWRDWGRGVLRNLLGLTGLTAWILTFGGAMHLAESQAGYEEPSLWILGGLLALGGPVGSLLLAAMSLRDVQFAEVPLPHRAKKGQEEEPDSNRSSLDDLLLGQRWEHLRSRRPLPIMRPRRPWRGPWAGHWRSWLGGVWTWKSWSGAFIFLWLAGAATVGMLNPLDKGPFVILAVLMMPRRVEVKDRQRAYLLGMDLREQAFHDFKALLLFVAVPLSMVAAAAFAWGRPTVSLPLTLDPPVEANPVRWMAVGSMAGGLLFRAGLPGIRNVAVRVGGLGTYVLWVVGLLTIAAIPLWRFDMPRALGVSGWVLGIAGLAGLGALLTRSEGDLRREMRADAEP